MQKRLQRKFPRNNEIFQNELHVTTLPCSWDWQHFPSTAAPRNLQWQIHWHADSSLNDIALSTCWWQGNKLRSCRMHLCKTSLIRHLNHMLSASYQKTRRDQTSLCIWKEKIWDTFSMLHASYIIYFSHSSSNQIIPPLEPQTDSSKNRYGKWQALSGEFHSEWSGCTKGCRRTGLIERGQEVFWNPMQC